MDVKTLSTIIGHVSSATTLNTYTHITDAMRQSAADKIDRGIGKAEPREQRGASAPKAAAQYLPGPQRTAAQAGHRLYQPDQRPSVGGAVLPRRQRPAHGPECLRQNGGGSARKSWPP